LSWSVLSAQALRVSIIVPSMRRTSAGFCGNCALTRRNVSPRSPTPPLPALTKLARLDSSDSICTGCLVFATGSTPPCRNAFAVPMLGLVRLT
jgi:hypothetical protein